jgi:hypothetical protein
MQVAKARLNLIRQAGDGLRCQEAIERAARSLTIAALMPCDVPFGSAAHRMTRNSRGGRQRHAADHRAAKHHGRACWLISFRIRWTEPYRVFRRLQLLRGWSHDEASSPIFP